jgi:hypothetical protein
MLYGRIPQYRRSRSTIEMKPIMRRGYVPGASGRTEWRLGLTRASNSRGICRTSRRDLTFQALVGGYLALSILRTQDDAGASVGAIAAVVASGA